MFGRLFVSPVSPHWFSRSSFLAFLPFLLFLLSVAQSAIGLYHGHLSRISPVEIPCWDDVVTDMALKKLPLFVMDDKEDADHWRVDPFIMFPRATSTAFTVIWAIIPLVFAAGALLLTFQHITRIVTRESGTQTAFVLALAWMVYFCMFVIQESDNTEFETHAICASTIAPELFEFQNLRRKVWAGRVYLILITVLVIAIYVIFGNMVTALSNRLHQQHSRGVVPMQNLPPQMPYPPVPPATAGLSPHAAVFPPNGAPAPPAPAQQGSAQQMPVPPPPVANPLSGTTAATATSNV